METALALVTVFGVCAGVVLWCQALSAAAIEQLERRRRRQQRRREQIERQLMALVHGPRWRA